MRAICWLVRETGTPFRAAVLGALGASMGACAGTESPLLVFSGGGGELVGGAAGASSLGGTTGGSGGDGSDTSDFVAPPPGASFQIQLSGSVDVDIEAEIFVVDYSGPSDETFATLRAASRYVGCYFSAGSYEPWRPDAEEFPSEVRGEPLPDYPNEDWLDVTSDVVVELMRARMEVAKMRGCDAVYPSIVRPSDDSTGFMISEAAYAAYAESLASAAHATGLAALYAGGGGLNGEEMLYDGALVFGCIAGGGCEGWVPFSESGRGVYLVEFGDAAAPLAACGQERPFGFPAIVKERDLSAFRFECP